jgi:hypothetical protein
LRHHNGRRCRACRMPMISWYQGRSPRSAARDACHRCLCSPVWRCSTEYCTMCCTVRGARPGLQEDRAQQPWCKPTTATYALQPCIFPCAGSTTCFRPRAATPLSPTPPQPSSVREVWAQPTAQACDDEHDTHTCDLWQRPSGAHACWGCSVLHMSTLQFCLALFPVPLGTDISTAWSSASWSPAVTTLVPCVPTTDFSPSEESCFNVHPCRFLPRL